LQVKVWVYQSTQKNTHTLTLMAYKFILLPFADICVWPFDSNKFVANILLFREYRFRFHCESTSVHDRSCSRFENINRAHSSQIEGVELFPSRACAENNCGKVPNRRQRLNCPRAKTKARSSWGPVSLARSKIFGKTP